MDVKQLKDDVQAGRIGLERLVDLIEAQQRQLRETQRQLEEANRLIAELEKKLGPQATNKVEGAFSVQAEEKRQAARGKIKRKRNRPARRGRVTTAEKVRRAERTERCYPAGVAESECWLSHTRPVWRLEDGRAVLIAYEIYRAPNGQYGKIRGVLGRSEFGLEIVIAISFQVHQLGLSFDQVCLLMGFFLKLDLKKSQVDALLTQLARHWEGEFERLCTLLANSAVVHADETSWSLNSVWAFLSEKARVIFFGVHKDAATLEEILDPATFAGILISDDAAVYANFTAAQKCWAHLLRKAIKLTLIAPDNAEYRQLADDLLAIYREACRVQRDGRLRDAGRAEKVAALDDRILELCGPMWFAELPPLEGPDNDYRLLCNEVMRLMLVKELFTFVTAPPVTAPTGQVVPVAGTNNEAERTLRNPATARDTGRTNKTFTGARRRTIHTSVLESLRCYLPEFTLSSVIAEVQRWLDTGHSCFARMLKKLRLPPHEHSVLEALYPKPDG
jgi:exonuclease VII small subunit